MDQFIYLLHILVGENAENIKLLSSYNHDMRLANSYNQG